jgi:hypothetical protein
MASGVYAAPLDVEIKYKPHAMGVALSHQLGYH